MDNKVQKLKLLTDKDFIITNTPYVTGIESDKIKLTFKRLFFKVTDTYRISTTMDKDNKIMIDFIGEKSSIHIEVWVDNNKINFKTVYRGPKKLIIKKLINQIAQKLVESASKEVIDKTKINSKTKLSTVDYGQKLASLAWTTRLIQRSILVDQRLLSLPSGGLIATIENILSEKNLLNEYNYVYISGTSDDGTFKLLFSNQGLLGIYVNLKGEEYFNDENILGKIQGLTTIRIYGILALPEEV